MTTSPLAARCVRGLTAGSAVAIATTMIVSTTIATTTMVSTATAQTPPPPVESLAEWPSEVIAFPPGFAPELPSGIESLRFAPGWRDPDGEHFWSYALSIWIDEPTPDAARIDALLELYYDGLIAAVGEGKRPAKDDDAAVGAAAGTGTGTGTAAAAADADADADDAAAADPADISVTRTGPHQFSATLKFDNAFGAFEPVVATARIHATATTRDRSVLRMQVSTRPAGDAIWPQLAAAVASTPRPEVAVSPTNGPLAPNAGDPLVDWNRCAAAVRDSGRYGALELRPQMGLVPLGADPESGLQEFLHLATHVGPIPTRGIDGRIPVTEDLGLIFVLIPPGTDWLGTQVGERNEPNHDPGGQPNETLRQASIAAPYMLSKYEVTQGQWERSAADERNPSEHAAPDERAVRNGRPAGRLGTTIDRRHPVESVSWEMATANLARMGLRLPTDEEWEYAARAGTSSIWGAGGDDPTKLTAWANLPGLDDGYHLPAPVGHYRPNAFGLHDVIGNVWEWTATPRINRGGSHASALHFARIAFVGGRGPDARNNSLGVRPARSLDGG
ncbi:MAG: formylglycine-generating enzyme family protein [Phycisphaerales bacterium]